MLDAKPQIQAKAPTAPVLPMRPGPAERRPHDDVRHGTTDLFAALDVQAGRVIVGACRPRHRSLEFRACLDQIDANAPAGLDVHLVLHHAATHKTQLIRSWLAKRAALPRALHADLGIMAEPGRELVRAADRTATQARRVPEHAEHG